MKQAHIILSDQDKSVLTQLISKGTSQTRIIKRAVGLLQLDKGATYKQVAALLQVQDATVASWSSRYRASGLDKALHDDQRPGRPIEISGECRAKITALVCSEAPEGYSQWSMRLVAERAVELNFCDKISHTLVSEILKKTNSSRI